MMGEKKMERSSSSSRRTGGWSDVPTELLSKIGNCLDNRIDTIRFRSVCTCWRSSILPPRRRLGVGKFPHFPLKLLPFSVYPTPTNNTISPNLQGYFTLSESTVYRLQLLEPPDTSSNSRKGWLVKVRETSQEEEEEEEEDKGKGDNNNNNNVVSLLHPMITKLRINHNHLPVTFPKVLDLSLFRITQVTKSFDIQTSKNNDGRSPGSLDKVVLSPSNGALLAINQQGRLCYLKLGDDLKWSLFDYEDVGKYRYQDVVYYKGKFYAVNDHGRLVMIDDSSFDITEIVSLHVRGGDKYYLVVCSGDLLLVDRILDDYDDMFALPRYPCPAASSVMVADFKVYKLNEDEHRWDKVNSLDDNVLFVADDCSFSVSATDFGGGCEGNCIYFFDDKGSVDEVLGRGVGVFKLEDGSGGQLTSFPGYASIFWPPPNRLTLTPSPLYV